MGKMKGDSKPQRSGVALSMQLGLSLFRVFFKKGSLSKMSC